MSSESIPYQQGEVIASRSAAPLRSSDGSEKLEMDVHGDGREQAKHHHPPRPHKEPSPSLSTFSLAGLIFSQVIAFIYIIGGIYLAARCVLYGRCPWSDSCCNVIVGLREGHCDRSGIQYHGHHRHGAHWLCPFHRPQICPRRREALGVQHQLKIVYSGSWLE